MQIFVYLALFFEKFYSGYILMMGFTGLRWLYVLFAQDRASLCLMYLLIVPPFDLRGAPMWAIIYGFLVLTGIMVNEHFWKGELIKSNDEQDDIYWNTRFFQKDSQSLNFPNNHIINKKWNWLNDK